MACASHPSSLKTIGCQGGQNMKCGKQDQRETIAKTKTQKADLREDVNKPQKINKKSTKEKIEIPAHVKNGKKESNNNDIIKVENGDLVQKELSDGEVTSEFETISSLSSLSAENMLDDILSDEEMVDIVVHLKNNLAYQSKRGKPSRHRDYRISDAGKEHQRNRRKRKRNTSEDRRYERGETWDDRSRDRYDLGYDRQKRSEDEELHRSSKFDFKQSRKYKSCRSPKRKKSRSPVSRESKRKREGSIGKFDQDDKPNPRKSFPGNENKLTNDRRRRRHDDRGSNSGSSRANDSRNNEARRSRTSRSYGNTKSSSSESLSESRKRSGNSRDVEKQRSNSHRKSKEHVPNKSRRKERTPFLVELEKRLQEMESLKKPKRAVVDVTAEEVTSAAPTFTTPATEPVMPVVDLTSIPLPNANPPSNPSLHLPLLLSTGSYESPGVYPPPNLSPFPTLSTDNLPLVPGLNGLPVHITATGEQVPHDIDGRKIPVGPNGHYLPLDPTGRLFPHIVSPENVAVPVHLSEDGVLRLPNMEPVPFGPPHQFPVNVDGSIILIGPDSKPVFHYPNIPRYPPLQLLGMTGSNTLPSFDGTLNGDQQPQQQMTKIEISKQDISTFNSDSVSTMHQTDSGAKSGVEDISTKTATDSGAKTPKNETEIPTDVMPKKNLKDEDDCCSDVVSTRNLSQQESNRSECVSASKQRFGMETCVSDSVAKILSSEDERMLQEICDASKNLTARESSVEKKPEDPIVRKVKLAIKSLSDRDFQPPVLGRFILPKRIYEPPETGSPNESPLLRGRVKLPFINPLAKEPTKVQNDQQVSFKFLPQKKPNENQTNSSSSSYERLKLLNLTSQRPAAVNFDFSVQCDFTSEEIKDLNSKIAELKIEMVKLKKLNANLFVSYKQAQSCCEKKNEVTKVNGRVGGKSYGI